MGMIELHQKRAAVIGLGQSGLAMARWLARAGCSRVQVFDDRAQPPGLEQLRTLVPEATFESRPLDASLLGDAAGVSAPEASNDGSGPARNGTAAASPCHSFAAGIPGRPVATRFPGDRVATGGRPPRRAPPVWSGLARRRG